MSIGQEIININNELPSTVKLVAVSKFHPAECIEEAYQAGQRIFAESRPQELAAKVEVLPKDIEWHFIGHLQTNKLKMVVPYASLIHSVDSIKLAKDIDRLAEARGIIMPILLEINSAKEENKSGIFPEDAEKLLIEISELKNVVVKGLMTMGPVCDDAEDIRPYFRLTKQLFDELNAKYGFGDDPTLSMGMSDSYRVAIEEGSTLVRVGRRLFIK